MSADLEDDDALDLRTETMQRSRDYGEVDWFGPQVSPVPQAARIKGL